MTKLTKQQIGLLEKELIELKKEKSNKEIGLFFYIISIIIIYFWGYDHIGFAISFGITIAIIIRSYIDQNDLKKTKQRIKDIEFKLAGDTNYLKKESEKPKEKTQLEKWREKNNIIIENKKEIPKRI